MITRIVKLHLEPSALPGFLKTFNSIKAEIRNFEGCRHLELLVDIEQSGVVFTVSRWESVKHFDAYLNSELFRSVWPGVKPLFKEKARAWSLLAADEILTQNPI